MLIQCPACQARTSLPDEKEGTKVRCLECGRVHVARAAPPRVASRLDRGVWIAAAVALLGLIFLALRRFSETEATHAGGRLEAPASSAPSLDADAGAVDPAERGD